MKILLVLATMLLTFGFVNAQYNAADFIGTWHCDCNEFLIKSIDFQAKSDKTLNYFMRFQNGGDGFGNETWNLVENTLYEYYNGKEIKSSLIWHNQNSFTLIIIDNGDSQYTGMKRYYVRQ